MNVSVIGKKMLLDFRGYKLSKLQENMIRSAASHALDLLVSKRMKNTLEITITIEKDLLHERNIWGDMDVDDDDRSPKLFEIRLNYSGVRSFKQLIRTLGHELVHVSQFATRRLRNLSGPYRVGFLTEHYNTRETEYYSRPWEIEAHDLEGEIYDYVLEKDQKIKDYIRDKKCLGWAISAVCGSDV